jgi:hypothetical protein
MRRLVFTSSVAAAHIYREDPSRVTSFHNRLDLSLTKCIIYGLIPKINDKRRLWTCKALGRILVDYSRARPLVPIASPRHAQPDEASERVCFFLSPLLYTLISK